MDSPSVETTAYFELYFEVPNPTGDQLAGYQLVLQLDPAGSGVTFTGGQATTDHVPVFTTGSLSVTTSPGGLLATDFLMSGSAPIDDGDGLLRVAFTVQPGTLGTFDVTIDTDPASGTLLSDMMGGSIDFSTTDGQITIVPEPASGILFLVVGTLAIARRRRG